MSAIQGLRYKFNKLLPKQQKYFKYFQAISEFYIQCADSDNKNKSPSVSVAIKVRAEQVYLL